MTHVFAVIRLTFVVKQHSYTYQCVLKIVRTLCNSSRGLFVGGYNQQDRIKIEKSVCSAVGWQVK